MISFVKLIEHIEGDKGIIGDLLLFGLIAYLIYVIFDIVSTPITITKRNRIFYFSVIPIMVLFSIYGFLLYMWVDIFDKLDVKYNGIGLAITLIFPSVFLFYFVYEDYKKFLECKMEEIEFRRKYPLRKVKQ